MKRIPLNDDELQAFLIIRKYITKLFCKSLDEIREEYPDIWQSRKSRKSIQTAFQNYFKGYFITKIHYISNEQRKEIEIKNRGYY